MSYTLKDIANELKVSTTTVHRALNGTGRISEETKTKVLEVAEKLQYHPNDIAKSLRSKKSMTIGLILKDMMVGHFYAQILKGIDEIATKEGYIINIAFSGGDPEKEKLMINSFCNRKMDGIIISPVTHSFVENYDYLKLNKIPFVFLDKFIPEVKADVVTSDCSVGIKKAIDYLVSLGHKEILFLSGSEYPSITVIDRINEYDKQIKNHNLSFSKVIYSNDYVGDDRNCGYCIVKNYLDDKSPDEKPTAMLCVNDSLAFGAIRALKDFGYKVPADMAVIGFNNDVMSDFISPRLTTIAQAKDEMGRAAMRILIDRINNYEDTDYIYKSFPTSLIKRDSV